MGANLRDSEGLGCSWEVWLIKMEKKLGAREKKVTTHHGVKMEMNLGTREGKVTSALEGYFRHEIKCYLIRHQTHPHLPQHDHNPPCVSHDA